MGAFSKLHALKDSKAFKLLLGGSAVGVGAVGTAFATTAVQHADPKTDDSAATVDLENGTASVDVDDVLGDDLDDPTADVVTPDSPDSPPTPDSPDSPDSPASPESPATPDSPASPATPDTPTTPDSPATPDTPDTSESPDSPASADSPDED